MLAKGALQKAIEGHSESNYEAIYEGFMDKGIELEDILPRENVFTYAAWQALGRQVRKGESGVKVVTMIPVTRKTAEEGQPEAEDAEKPRLMQRSVTVFHVSQTKPVGEEG
ncbi:ArdC-like ssDNA-binding domain-containing protein [Metapseudomonas otitidis]|uniref:ArdC-like ssDNA-binding domain-containing protein n=1 Tax=Metapseudomonas otitidis TaxID=319939 RepID=UPI0013DF7734|nr:ArdC family protein [Pseudomonas otitidis]